MKLEEIFPDGEWIGDEYLIRCPICGDHPTHNHCYVNEKKGLFVCHYCGEKGTLKYLLRKFADGVELEPRPEVTEKKKYEKVDFSVFPRIEKEAHQTKARKAYEYLMRRGLADEELEIYDIRYATEGRYIGRILIPVYEVGRVVCFSARAYYEFLKPKYLFPHHGETILTAGEAIFGYDRAKKSGTVNICIVEGALDAIAINRKYQSKRYGLALMGNSITDAQINKLLLLDKSVLFYVMLDSTARFEALRVAKKLEMYGRTVLVAFLKDGDPDSATREELDFALKNAQPFSFDLEMEEGLK